LLSYFNAIKKPAIKQAQFFGVSRFRFFGVRGSKAGFSIIGYCDTKVG